MATRSSLSTGGTREKLKSVTSSPASSETRMSWADPLTSPRALTATSTSLTTSWVASGESLRAKGRRPRESQRPTSTRSGFRPASPPASDPQQIARGQALYEASACAGCHEPGLASKQGGMHPLKNLAQRYSAQELEGLLQTPPANMPRFPFTPSQREDLAAYLLQMHASPSHP